MVMCVECMLNVGMAFVSARERRPEDGQARK